MAFSRARVQRGLHIMMLKGSGSILIYMGNLGVIFEQLLTHPKTVVFYNIGFEGLDLAIHCVCRQEVCGTFARQFFLNLRGLRKIILVVRTTPFDTVKREVS